MPRPPRHPCASNRRAALRHRLIVVVIACLASTAATAWAQTGGIGAPAAPGAAAGRTPSGDNPPAPMVMLVPVEISSKAVESGCWVQMYDERNFKGDMLTIAGPTELQAMDDDSGRAFKRRIDSLTTGPKATLTVFEHRLFKDRSAVFGPNTREPGLLRKLGFGGRIQSMRVDCTR